MSVMKVRATPATICAGKVLMTAHNTSTHTRAHTHLVHDRVLLGERLDVLHRLRRHLREGNRVQLPAARTGELYSHTPNVNCTVTRHRMFMTRMILPLLTHLGASGSTTFDFFSTLTSSISSDLLRARA